MACRIRDSLTDADGLSRINTPRDSRFYITPTDENFVVIDCVGIRSDRSPPNLGAGKSIAARIAMMAITTSNSINVNRNERDIVL